MKANTHTHTHTHTHTIYFHLKWWLILFRAHRLPPEKSVQFMFEVVFDQRSHTRLLSLISCHGSFAAFCESLCTSFLKLPFHFACEMVHTSDSRERHCTIKYARCCQKLAGCVRLHEIFIIDCVCFFGAHRKEKANNWCMHICMVYVYVFMCTQRLLVWFESIPLWGSAGYLLTVLSIVR